MSKYVVEFELFLKEDKQFDTNEFKPFLLYLCVLKHYSTAILIFLNDDF